LKVGDIIFQALPWFYFHHEEMVTILLELSSRSELIVKGISYIFKTSEGVLRERIEPMISGSLKAGRERPTQEVVMSIDCYLVLKLAKM